MTIAFDAAVEDYLETLSDPFDQTFAHTCTGSDRHLSVWVAIDVETAIDDVTYNAISLTALAGIDVPGGTSWRVEAWGIAAPATGANDVVVANDGDRQIWSVAASYTGVDQATPSDTPQTVTVSSGGTITDDVTSETGDLVIGMFANTARTPVVGADQTARAERDVNATITGMFSDEPGGTTITISHGWTLNRFAAQIAMNLNAAAAGGLLPRLTLLGAG